MIDQLNAFKWQPLFKSLPHIETILNGGKAIIGTPKSRILVLPTPKGSTIFSETDQPRCRVWFILEPPDLENPDKVRELVITGFSLEDV